MSEAFLDIVNLSLSASWLAAAVMGFRFLLRKAPKAMHVALWGLVALRLLLPVSLESNLSLVPEAIGSGAAVEEWVKTPVGPHVIAVKPEGAPVQTDTPVQSPTVPEVPGEMHSPVTTTPVTTLGDTLIPALTSVWILGIGAMAVYALGSYLTLWWHIRTAVRLRDNIYQSEFAPTAFVLGLIRPRIYVPYGMSDGELAHVVAHERSHIARGDHWWKPLGYLLLTVHWFNPLLWVAYFLLCRDIELACDERVIRGLGCAQRADYSQTLLSCTIRQKLIFACPVAFGQAGVKERVRNVLNYRKPGLWITLVTVLAMVVSLVCFYAVPPVQADEPDRTLAQPEQNKTEEINQHLENFENLQERLENEMNQMEDEASKLLGLGEPNAGSSVTLTTGNGIEYTVSASSVTPVGMRFNVDVDVKCTFLIENYYWIEQQTENGWEALPAMMEDPCHLASKFGASGNNIFPGPTDSRTVDWSGIYGVLEPGTYRFNTVVFEGEDPARVEFTIGDPGDSAAGQALKRYYAALDALLIQDSYYIQYTAGGYEDFSVDVDADPRDNNYTDIHEIMRSHDDYLLQEYTYRTDTLNDGFMIRDGVEYRMDNEVYGNITTPAIGWYPAPAARTSHFTFWTAHSIWNVNQVTSVETAGNTVTLSVTDCDYLAGPVLSDTVVITFGEDGSLKQMVQTTEFGPGGQREKAWTSINTLTVMDSDAEAIAELIDLQDVNFCRDFTWTGTQPEDETVMDRAFVNTEAAPMDTVSQVIDRAKAEATATYTNIMVLYDAQNMVWKVEFWAGYGKHYIESVYLNADGTTLLITERGPRDI